MPSRFTGEIPEQHVDNLVSEGFYGNYGGAGFRDNQAEFSSTYSSPGWRRAQAARAAAAPNAQPAVIEARAKTVTSAAEPASIYGAGERVFHQKFGYGRIVAVEGNKLLIDFDKAGSKRVMDGFVTRA